MSASFVRRQGCNCGHTYAVMEYIKEGLWPLSPKTNKFLSFGLMDMMSQLMNSSPTVSYHAIAQAINNLVQRKTKQVTCFITTNSN